MESYSVVGKPLTRVDARAKATGEAKFTDDFSLPQMLWGKILPFYPQEILHSFSRKGK